MRTPIFASGIAAALLIATATPASAQSQTDRARIAIKEAQTKVDLASQLGASGDVPRLQAQAQAALRDAQEELASGRERGAIAAANQASQFADTAIGVSQRNQAAAAQAQTSDAEAAAQAAQQQAADANARADSAEQAAAAAQADAAAARAAPPVVLAPPPTTTVTTETTKVATPVRSTPRKVTKVVRKSAPRASVTEKTTTTVETN